MVKKIRVTDAFVAPWWLRTGHGQTLWPYFMQARSALNVRTERLELADGDFLDLSWVGEAGPIVIILHGLGGSIDSHYARGMLRGVVARGWRGVVMHFRGCSGEPNRLPRGYHAGETGDFDRVVEVLRRREPETALAAVGYSLGGNVLLKWLGERGEAAPLRAAAAVSVPFDLAAATAHLTRGFSRIYERRLLRCLQHVLIQKRARMPLPWDAAAIAAIGSLREFDERVTAPLHGFENADDYYRRASCRPYLRHIHTPTLIVHASDDPFMPPHVVPSADDLAEGTILEHVERGGHVGFVGGPPWAPRYWLEARISEYLAEILSPSP